MSVSPHVGQSWLASARLSEVKAASVLLATRLKGQKYKEGFYFLPFRLQDKTSWMLSVVESIIFDRTALRHIYDLFAYYKMIYSGSIGIFFAYFKKNINIFRMFLMDSL